MKPTAPCKDCEDRHSGCHSECEKYKAFKEEQYDKLADHVRKHVDMDLVYKILGND